LLRGWMYRGKNLPNSTLDISAWEKCNPMLVLAKWTAFRRCSGNRKLIL